MKTKITIKKIIECAAGLFLFLLAFQFTKIDVSAETPYNYFDSVDGVLWQAGVYSDGTVSIKPFYPENLSGTVCIPNEICGYKITKIEDDAFSGVHNVDKIVVKPGIQVVGDKAFSGCYYLKEIYLPETVKEIKLGAFWLLHDLEKVGIAEDVHIEISAFFGCRSISSVYVLGTEDNMTMENNNETLRNAQHYYLEPRITKNPISATYEKGEFCVTPLSVEVSKAENSFDSISYQWYSNKQNDSTSGTKITGATSATYTPSTLDVGTTYYYCEVTNNCFDYEIVRKSEVARVAVSGISYTVTFKSNGKTYLQQSVAEGESIVEPNVPWYKGYVFEGWYTDEQCTAQYYFGSYAWSDLTLYAKWRIDYSELLTVVERVSDDLEEDEFVAMYTEDSVNALYRALAKGERMLRKRNAVTAQEVIDITSYLNETERALVPVAQ